MKSIYLRSYFNNEDDFLVNDDDPVDVNRFIDNWNTMERSAYINLAGLILFLFSAVMGFVILFLGRRISNSSSRGKV